MVDAEKLKQALLALGNPDYSVRKPAFEYVDSLGESAIESLIDNLASPDAFLREVSFDFLWGIHRDHPFRNDRLVTALMNLIPNEINPLTQGEAAFFLAQYADPRTFDFFVNLLKHPEEDLRAEAAHGLGNLRDARAMPHLIQALEVEQDSEVKNEAIAALGRIGDNSAIPILTDYLFGHAQLVVGYRFSHAPIAKWSLEQIGTPEALAVLKRREDELNSVEWNPKDLNSE